MMKWMVVVVLKCDEWLCEKEKKVVIGGESLLVVHATLRNNEVNELR